MHLNDLLRGKNIDPEQVLVLRHRPIEPKLNKVLPWLAAERPELFNAYQAFQGEKLERVMTGAKYVASFIAHGPGRALFVGLYAIGSFKALTPEQFDKVPSIVELRILGKMAESDPSRERILHFDLQLQDFYSHWKGKLVVDWPPPERSWWRRSHRNDIAVALIHAESMLEEAANKPWDEIVLAWDELRIMPSRLKAALREWRGIYYIFDESDGKGYVGSAYGTANLLGRWENYAAIGHGGNRLLLKRNPKNFKFSILQRVSPDLDPTDVIRLESTWKERLHTRDPFGLNDN